MTRINVVAEGQSELYFATRSLNSYFGDRLFLYARCVLTSRDKRTRYEHRGGLLRYSHAKHDIITWMKEDTDAYVTTMFDFYALPKDFPGFTEAMRQPDSIQQIRALEDALARDIHAALPGLSPERFIPYIQAHEFESLLFTDITVLKEIYFEYEAEITRLYEDTRSIQPEDINQGPETAPSKRIQCAIPCYRKGEELSDFLDYIGVNRIRERCPHFDQWLRKLEGLIL